MKIEANATGDCVEITQLNSGQPSFVNGQPLLFPWSKMLMPGDYICLSKNAHEYVLERSAENFKPESVDAFPSRSTKKRKHTDEEDETAPKTPGQNDDFKKKTCNKEKRRSLWSPSELVHQLCVFNSGGRPIPPKKSGMS